MLAIDLAFTEAFHLEINKKIAKNWNLKKMKRFLIQKRFMEMPQTQQNSKELKIIYIVL
jgi:hypothetical protein